MGAVELMAQHKTTIDVANLLFVGLMPSGDRVALKGEFGNVVILDSIEVMFVNGNSLSRIISIETLYFVKIAFRIDLLSH